MDAKPQRTRGLHRDENSVPAATQSKPTLHQRGKSTSALVSMATAGGLKAGAKRTAFQDISNMRIAVDDSAIPGKKNAQVDTVKPLALQSKPARIPSITSNHSNAQGPISIPMSTKTHLADLQQPVAQQANKRTLSSKGTKIYKDTVGEGEGDERLEPAQVALVPQAVIPESHISQSALNRNDQQRPERQNRSGESAVRYTFDNIHLEVESATTNAVVEPATSEAIVSPIIPLDSRPTREAIDHARQSLPATGSETEEHWEEEEDLEDDQAYTTAHSYRSRGDNTTGGVTTMLVPKVSARVKAELAEAKIHVEATRSQEEVEDEAWDTSMVAEYGDEIFGYMRELEKKMLPNAHYMDNQAEIQWSMRSVLMDWLIQVHHRFSLLPETLFLCINYIDRFLSCKVVSLGKLQLVGATAIFIAAKYEEINCPSVSEIVYMVDGGYTADEILKAERFMLTMLQFELGWPGPMSFLRRISKADDYDLETRTLAKYFLEVTIMDERFVGSPPSFLAAGAHCLSRFMLKKGDWSQAHVYYSGYTYAQLRPLVEMLTGCCVEPHKHHSAVYEKYADRRYKRASVYVRAEMDGGFKVPEFHRPTPTIEYLVARAALVRAQA